MQDFVHLHVHTEYSLLDGAARLDTLIERVKSLGQSAVAVTDHGVMYGVAEFYKKAKAAGIKPIIGCEVYVAPRDRQMKEQGIDSKYSHLVLLCKNDIGYRNLLKIVSDAFINGFYYKPRTDLDMLSGHSEGLIALSGCIAGEVQRFILNDDIDGATAAAVRYRDIFGDDFYLELQDHLLDEDKKIVPGLLEIAEKTGIPLVATNDSHYVDKGDAYVQRVLMCISMNKSIYEENPLAFQNDEFYLKSAREMAELFPQATFAVENTVKIADMCNVELDFDTMHLPRFSLPEGVSSFEYLKSLCIKGLERRYGSKAAHLDRLEYELDVIKEMGFTDYFLIVSDFVGFAKSSGIAVGPGRGSATGSLVSYCLSITDIDPIRYELMFERFLNPSRASMPDIDIDFCVERRQEVINYIVEKYGEQSVSQIITFGTLAARAAIKDVGRVLEVSYSTVETVSKHFPQKTGITISSVMEKDAQLSKMYKENDEIRRLIDTAKLVEGFPRHGSTHAAGIVITDGPVSDYLPLARNDDVIVTQFQKTEVEQLGLLKIDLLGLRNMSVIAKTEELVRADNPDFRIDDVPFDDAETYSMISEGNTFGVFQLESPGMRKLLQRLRPAALEDIIAAISLYRPGPMDSIPQYLKNRKEPQKIEYVTEKLRPILSDTCGCIVYQEQVMKIAQEIAGYSLAHADVLRAAMSKKKYDVMENEREIFIEGAVANGVTEDAARSIFEDMSEFARYGFNKSHAAGYAVIAYRTAYLKAHYPSMFMAALLTSVTGSISKIKEYITESRRLGIRIFPPDINKSRDIFCAGEDGIYFSLAAVKTVGKSLAEQITAEREQNGDFTDFRDFVYRMGDALNRRAVESLAKCGTFDSLGFSRRHILSVCDRMLSEAALERKAGEDLQLSFFDDGSQRLMPDYFSNPVHEFDISEKLMFEKESLGIYLSEHPLKPLEGVYRAEKYNFISDILKSEKRDGRVRIMGLVDGVRVITTKQRRDMAYVSVEDLTDSIDVIVFPNVYETYKSQIETGALVEIIGELSEKDDETVQLRCNNLRFLNKDSLLEEIKKLYLNFETQDAAVYNDVLSLLKQNRGTHTCVFHFKDSGKTLSTAGKLTVSLEYSMIVKLKKMLGNENVVIK